MDELNQSGDLEGEKNQRTEKQGKNIQNTAQRDKKKAENKI